MIPRKKVEYRGSTFEEMDTEAIMARHPQVAVVDEFPHTNVPGSPREKRWEDVLFILENGIDVITTMNVQHLESLNDQMAQITGVKVRETIPDWVVKQAGEVVMVDLTPRALLNRLERGVVYPADKAQTGAGELFQGIDAGGACARWLCGRQRMKWKSGWSRREEAAADPTRDPKPPLSAEAGRCGGDLHQRRSIDGDVDPPRQTGGGHHSRRLFCRLRGGAQRLADVCRRPSARRWNGT